MEKDYLKHVASTEAEEVFLHRCFPSSLDGILREGLTSGADLSSTATLQPRKLEDADVVYKNYRDHGPVVIVIAFPVELWAEARGKSRRNEIGNRKLGYFHPKRRNFTVQPKFVKGWIDRETDEYHENPYPDRKPVAGHEEFESSMD